MHFIGGLEDFGRPGGSRHLNCSPGQRHQDCNAEEAVVQDHRHA